MFLFKAPIIPLSSRYGLASIRSQFAPHPISFHSTSRLFYSSKVTNEVANGDNNNTTTKTTEKGTKKPANVDLLQLYSPLGQPIGIGGKLMSGESPPPVKSRRRSKPPNKTPTKDPNVPPPVSLTAKPSKIIAPSPSTQPAPKKTLEQFPEGGISGISNNKSKPTTSAVNTPPLSEPPTLTLQSNHPVTTAPVLPKIPSSSKRKTSLATATSTTTSATSPPTPILSATAEPQASPKPKSKAPPLPKTAAQPTPLNKSPTPLANAPSQTTSKAPQSLGHAQSRQYSSRPPSPSGFSASQQIRHMSSSAQQAPLSSFKRGDTPYAGSNSQDVNDSELAMEMQYKVIKDVTPESILEVGPKVVEESLLDAPQQLPKQTEKLVKQAGKPTVKKAKSTTVKVVEDTKNIANTTTDAKPEEPANATVKKKSRAKAGTTSSKKRTKKQDVDELPSKENAEWLEHPLTSEQERVVQLIVEQEKNVFFTGSAGTGKSFVLKHLVTRLRKKYPKGVFVTAATGIAAVNIGGVTLHSFAGIRLGHGATEKLVESVKKSKKYVKRWTQCKVLVVDEVSMIDADLFEKLDAVGRAVRKVDQPFGGIQLVLSGDFFQLPPVHGAYAFESPKWKQSIDMCVELTTVMRQKDHKFIAILNELRRGVAKYIENLFSKVDHIQILSHHSMMELRKCCRPFNVEDGITPTKLYATNAAVDQENNTKLAELTGKEYRYESVDYGSEELLSLLNKDCPAGGVLTLKEGAQVVLLRKCTSRGMENLVNGSLGVVVGFAHRRGRSSQRFQHWDSQHQSLPIVKFASEEEPVTVGPVEWEVWNGQMGRRHQLPLKLAWAFTIHRAQGMTIDKVECKLNTAFASGQGYVALSRARRLEGLYLKDFSRAAVKASPKVLHFTKNNVQVVRFSNNEGTDEVSKATDSLAETKLQSPNDQPVKIEPIYGFSEQNGVTVDKEMFFHNGPGLDPIQRRIMANNRLRGSLPRAGGGQQIIRSNSEPLPPKPTTSPYNPLSKPAPPRQIVPPLRGSSQPAPPRQQHHSTSSVPHPTPPHRPSLRQNPFSHSQKAPVSSSQNLPASNQNLPPSNQNLPSSNQNPSRSHHPRVIVPRTSHPPSNTRKVSSEDLQASLGLNMSFHKNLLS